ncbi:MAG: hypothetical protein ACRDT8_01250 [Micromonosporaceae bacterium]
MHPIHHMQVEERILTVQSPGTHRYPGAPIAPVEQWGGRASLAALPELCGSYGRDPLLDALNATLTFTHRLGHELADRWGHRYPTAGHREVAAFLSDIT